MLRMKPVASFLALLVLTVPCYAQSAKADESVLRAAILKKQRYMRGFSADMDIRWRWKDGALVEDDPKTHIFAALLTKSVKMSGQKIEIAADRLAVFRDKSGKMFLSPLRESVKVTVDLTGADLSIVMPQLADDLFFQDLDEAVAALPAVYQHSVPPYADLTQQPKPNPPAVQCDCALALEKKCGEANNLKNEGTKPPRLVYSVEPEFSEEARVHKYNGNIQTAMMIDETGKPSDIWIVRPSGMQLDQQAANAVRQYRFEPATCHGKPVAIHLYIDVNFQIF